MASTSVEQAIRRYFAAIRAMDADAWVATFAEDGVNYDPSGPPVRGHQALRQFFLSIGGAFTRIDMTEERLFVVGNRAAVLFRGRGTGTNGRAVTFEGIDVFEVNDRGAIQSLWGYWDPAGMMATLLG